MIAWRLRLYRGYLMVAFIRAVAPARGRQHVEAMADAVARIHAILDGDDWALRA